jgi:hypothetical protein
MPGPTQEKRSGTIRLKDRFLAFIKSLFGEQTKDERLKNLRYRAGFYAFNVTSLLTILALIVSKYLNTPERFSTRTLIVLPWFGGAMTFTFFLMRKRYGEDVLEIWARTPEGQKRFRRGLVYTGLVYTVYWFAVLRLGFLSFRGGLLCDVLYSLFMSLFMVAIQWWDFARRRKKLLSQNPQTQSDTERGHV